MTQPTAPTDEAVAYEGAVVAATTTALVAALAAVVVAWWALWRRLTVAGLIGTDTARTLLRLRLVELLDDVTVAVSDRLAAELAGHGVGDDVLATVVAELDAVVSAEMSAASTLAGSLALDTEADATAVAAKVIGAGKRAEAGAAWAANRARNADTAADAARRGLALLWVAEVDACLHCLAYAGEVTEPGRDFRRGLTFYLDPAGNPKPIERDELPYPPLHPRCRCDVRIYDAVGSPGLPDTLKREAQRAVALGRSAYASDAAARRAANNLLRGVTLLPRTVVRRGRERAA